MAQNTEASPLPKVQPLVTVAPSSGGQITKLIFANNSTLANHGANTTISTALGPQSILLASPNKTLTITKTMGNQPMLKAMPGTPTKQTVFVLPPLKSAQRMPLHAQQATLKSPIRIAPANALPFQTLLGSKVAVPVSAAGTGLPKTITIQQSPKKVLVKPLLTSIPTSNFSTVVNPVQATSSSSSVSSVSSQQVQMPNNKFHYVRLVASSGSASTTSVKKPVTVTASPAHSITTVNISTSTPTSTTCTTPIRLNIPMSSVMGGQRAIAISKTGQKTIIPAPLGTQIRSGSTLSAGQLGQIPSGTLIPIGGSGQSFVVLPPNYLAQMQSPSVQVQNQGTSVVLQNIQNLNLIPTSSASNVSKDSEQRNILSASIAAASADASATRTTYIPIAPSAMNMAATASSSQLCSPPPCASSASRYFNGRMPLSACDPRPRKPCNCTKSQCLKLYCECFANGEFCNCCNCNNCYNNLDHEIERQKAIKACLDRNPMAFHPKIGKTQGTDKERRHTKGCNCRRSGCLKNYCECYEAKILCTNLCRCIGCKNFEDGSDKKTLLHLADAAEVRVQQQAMASANVSSQILKLPMRPARGAKRGPNPSSLINDEVVQFTIDCLMAQAHNAESDGTSKVETEMQILKEFGNCLRTLISLSNDAEESDSSSEHNN